MNFQKLCYPGFAYYKNCSIVKIRKVIKIIAGAVLLIVTEGAYHQYHRSTFVLFQILTPALMNSWFFQEQFFEGKTHFYLKIQIFAGGIFEICPHIDFMTI